MKSGLWSKMTNKKKGRDSRSSSRASLEEALAVAAHLACKTSLDSSSVDSLSMDSMDLESPPVSPIRKLSRGQFSPVHVSMACLHSY